MVSLTRVRESRKFGQRGVQIWYFFLSWWGERGSKYRYKWMGWAIIGPPVKRHLNGVSLAGRWWPNIKCWLRSFVVYSGNPTSIAKKPYIFVIFQGGGVSGPPVPPLDPLMTLHWELDKMFLIHGWQSVECETGGLAKTSGRLISGFAKRIRKRYTNNECSRLKAVNLN